jgi:hypothetical protein
VSRGEKAWPAGPVGTPVVITGTGLKQTTTVKFGGVKATTFTVNSDTQVTLTYPPARRPARSPSPPGAEVPRVRQASRSTSRTRVRHFSRFSRKWGFSQRLPLTSFITMERYAPSPRQHPNGATQPDPDQPVRPRPATRLAECGSPALTSKAGPTQSGPRLRSS